MVTGRGDHPAGEPSREPYNGPPASAQPPSTERPGHQAPGEGRFCPRCRRANPPEATFCHYDGQDLRLVLPGLSEPWELPKEFLFPSGKRCRTFDEFVDACIADWKAGCALLEQGAIHQFFSATGRADIAQIAWEAVRRGQDLDEALDWFLSRLPTKEQLRPELDFTPRKLQFGRVIMGDRRTLVLRIMNRGKGLLRGRVRLEGISWLEIEGTQPLNETTDPSRNSASPAWAAIENSEIPVAELLPDAALPASQPQNNDGPSPDDATAVGLLNRSSEGEVGYLVRVWTEQELRITVLTEALAAGQTYHTRLILETNGGTVEVPVHVEVAAVPFAHEPFRGATDAKHLAAAMRSRPKEAARLLREGLVRQWFETNQWVWPVLGDTAPGIAAVQQFYEALGVSKPPRLEIEPAAVHCVLTSEEPLQRNIEYRSPDPKWVYARLESTAGWLQVEPREIYGPRKANFQITILPTELPGPGEYQAEVQIEGNAGQRLSLPVRVESPEPQLQLALYLLLGSLVFGLAGALIRLLLAWPDLIGIEPSRHWSSFAALVTVQVSKTYQWMMALTAAVGLGAWLASKLWRKNRSWEEAFSGFFGGGLLGLLIGALLSWALVHGEPQLALLFRWIQSERMVSFPGMAVAVWYLLGGLAGVLLALLGKPGQRAIRWLAREFAWLAKLLGWRKVAAFFALRW